MTSTLVKKAALDLALKRGLVGVDGAGQGTEDLRDHVRRQLLDLETMQLLEREAELLLSGKYPEHGDEPTAVSPEMGGVPRINPLGLYPWQDWSRFRPEVYLGEGGMGRVFRVQDVRLKRRVALKFFRAAMDNVAKAFLREAQSQARIEHPNVAKVFEAGEQEGIPFLSMQFVHGPTLSEAAPNLDLREKVDLVRQAALGVHAAHRLGIVHRDLKPGNILLESDEQGAWKALVVDFGLARDLTDIPSGMTGLMGTPAYMSPEQIEGPSVLVGPHSDVYSLGVTLFGLLAGRLPFVGNNQVEIIRKIVEEDSPTLRKVDPSMPRDLEAIIQRCMEKDLLKRYDSALDLADDLERFLDGRPVLASPVGHLSRFLKRVRRNPLPLTALSAVLLLSGGWLAYALATRSRERALDLYVQAQGENLARIRSEMDDLKFKQIAERKRSDDLLRQIAQAQTPLERLKAEELLRASQSRERELGMAVVEAQRRIPGLAGASSQEMKSRPQVEANSSETPPMDPSGKRSDIPEKKADASNQDRAAKSIPESVDPAYTPPRIVYQTPGKYPRKALTDPLNPYSETGVTVVVRVQLDPHGHPEKISLVQEVPGSLGYNEAAIEAVRRSIYAPALLGGKPVAGILEVRIKFEKVSN